MSESKKDSLLSVEVEDGELVIRIGSGTMAFALELSAENNPFDEDLNDFKRLFRVTKPLVLASDIRTELCREAEDGSTPLTRLLDSMYFAAIDAGTDGVRECPKLKKKK
jgi:hypothetical protein